MYKQKSNENSQAPHNVNSEGKHNEKKQCDPHTSFVLNFSTHFEVFF